VKIETGASLASAIGQVNVVNTVSGPIHNDDEHPTVNSSTTKGPNPFGRACRSVG